MKAHLIVSISGVADYITQHDEDDIFGYNLSPVYSCNVKMPLWFYTKQYDPSTLSYMWLYGRYQLSKMKLCLSIEDAVSILYSMGYSEVMVYRYG